ncbi:MAG: response regulator [Anaerolineae bacterium]|nr:response regulator [Anaerolineae bacterium]
MGRSASTEVVDLGEVVQAVLRITEPLVRSLGAHVECQVTAGLGRVAAHPVTLRQALLNALTATVRSVPGGNVTIRAEAADRQIALLLQPKGLAASSPSSAALLERLEISRQLLALSGGSLEITEGEGERAFAVRLTLAPAGQITVLVVDDNADTLALLRRYLTGSPYAFYGTTDPGQAPALAEQVGARIIVLDLMLPGIDGWELLARLREHPRTRCVPIVVCSILPEEELALTLGAADFIRKPVTRSALLAALDRQARELTTRSC